MAINNGNDEELIEDQTVNLRSEHSTYPLLVQFLNRTGRRVELVWVDYAGHWIRYKTLSPGDHFEIYTFVTHPWVFRDTVTGIRLLALNHGPVFVPTTRDVQEVSDPEGVTHLIPTLVSITVPVFNLKERCLETIHRCINDKAHVRQLDIPQELQQDVLHKMTNFENETIIPAGAEHVGH